MKYPKGTKAQAWSLFYESQKGIRRPVVRRWVTYPSGQKKCERLPTAKYAHFRGKPEELAKFVLRMNEELRKEQAAKTAAAVKHAFIDEALYERYRKLRSLEVPSQDRVSTELHYIKVHFVNFFVGRQNLPSPRDWHRVHREVWAEYLLLDPEVPKAPATLREIIQSANRFMGWVREQRPDEIPEAKFRPISKDRFRELIARRELDPKVKKRKYIPDDHWAKIIKSCPPEIECFVHIANAYGLRRSETLGVLPGDVRKDRLSVERQLEFLEPKPGYKPLKGKEKRSVPHWFSSAAEAYGWVEAAQKWRIDPDHLTDLWKDLMEALGYDYDFHDIRHRFITKALRIQHRREVQLAAGHKHEKTTMGYAHDDRDLQDDVYKPPAA